MNKKILLFCLILFLGIFLRIYNLNNIPPGVNQDEASIGYTAYSLLQTGADEYGEKFPLSFQSFGDWKLPLYIYLTTLMVKLFGLNEFAVRIISASMGVATVGLTFFLVRELLHKTSIAFLTMFLLAIAPWHVHLSRVESESNTAIFFITLGVFLFLKSLKTLWLLIPSFTSFALTYYIYAGNHVFTTILVVIMCVLYRNTFLKNKWAIPAISIFMVLSGVIFYSTLFEASKTKISGIGIFGDPSVVHAKIEIPRTQHNDAASNLFARVVHNRVIYAGEKIFQNYLNSYSPEFLFISGGTNRAHNIKNFGNMYLVESIFLYVGLFTLFMMKKRKEEKIILLWFFIAPLAASITKDAPHTNRMVAIFPILPLVVAIGMTSIVELFKKVKVKAVVISVIGIVFILNFCVYIDRYFVHFPRNEAQRWGIGYKQLVSVLSQPEFSSKHIIMTKPEYSRYVYLVFYMQYDPKKYQQTAVRYPPTSDGFIHVKQFDRFEFRDIDWEKDLTKDYLLIADSTEVPKELQGKKQTAITLPDGSSLFTLIY